jgi:hypothetical protein
VAASRGSANKFKGKERTLFRVGCASFGTMIACNGSRIKKLNINILNVSIERGYMLERFSRIAMHDMPCVFQRHKHVMKSCQGLRDQKAQQGNLDTDFTARS